MSAGRGIVSAHGILRIVELLFSIICFALVASWNGWDKVDFVLFTGITTMLFCLVFLPLYMSNMSEKSGFVLTEFVINILWWIFWLSTAAVLSDIAANSSASDKYGYVDLAGDRGKFQASCAFAWLTFFLWTASTFISFKTFREGGSTTGPPVPNVGMV